MGMTRREMLAAGASGSAVLLLVPSSAGASDETAEIVEQLTGRAAVESDRLHLTMPAEFPNGYTVPMEIVVDSAMTASDHVRYVRVFAPKNPLPEVVRFDFVPERGVARVSTRIRLAEPQHVVAVAEMGDNTLLAAKAWVAVATNGCK